MKPLPTADIRSNIATWAVPNHHLPAVTVRMLDLLPAENYDPTFAGQSLETTYFDTRGFKLRKARKGGDKYLTVRVRCYGSTDTYALSAKTESAKFRAEIDPALAETLIAEGIPSPETLPLPPDMAARLIDLTDGEPVVPAVTVCFRRYAAEDAHDRLTLDVHVKTESGKEFWANVLEQKSADGQGDPFPVFAGLGLKPIKMSKFLWATRV